MADDLADLEFVGAVWCAGYTHDKQPLLKLLRSDYPLSTADRAYLADFIEGKVKRPAGRPPPRATDAIKNPDAENLDRAAFYVPLVKRRLRKEGGSTRGIHKRAVALTMTWLTSKGFEVPDEQKLENRLRRSKKSRAKKPRA